MSLKREFEFKLDRTTKLLADIRELCMSSDYSDVTFIIEGEKIHGHRNVLAKRSEYFRSMLFGEFTESTQLEVYLDVPLNAFKILLNYIYTGSIQSVAFNDESILELLKLAHEYQFTEVVEGISIHLVDNLSLKNCFAFKEAARFYDLQPAERAATTFIECNAFYLLELEQFESISFDLLCSLLKSNAFEAPEIKIFSAVVRWCQNNREVDVERILPLIRFPLMSIEEMLTTVRESRILSSSRLINLIRQQTPRIPTTKKNINFAVAELNAKTTCGGNPSQLLSGNCNYTSGFTDHLVNGYIMVELGRAYFINHIKLLLHSPNKEKYSYYIEVMGDDMKWKRVVDYTMYVCRSWQFLYFGLRPVRFVKIVGRASWPGSTSFRVVAFEAYNVSEQPTLNKETISPTHNVATTQLGAKVVQGHCDDQDTLDVLLDSDFSNYNSSTGYAYHYIAKGSITVQLSQPYHIGSLRLLLWSRDDRTYSFYIETSTNKEDWRMAVDKRNEQLSSWQQFTFEPRNVVFFKIVGTYHSAGSGFCAVHFEAPYTGSDIS